MYVKRCLIFILLSLVLSQCTSVRITTKYDKTTDFSKYKTFKLITPIIQQPKGSTQNSIYTKEVRKEIHQIMEAKGYTETESFDDADMLIIYSLIKNPPNYMRRLPGLNTSHHDNPVEGALEIDIMDKAVLKSIWQGMGSDTLDSNNPSKDLAKAFSNIIKAFPPKVKH